MSRGHDVSADHWSLGILIYEMLMGEHPFYLEGMDQIVLFRSICQDSYEGPSGVSDEATDLIEKFLEKDPTHRLGSLAAGESEVLNHAWFQPLDLQAMRRRKAVKDVPWIPEIEDPMDASCFEDWSQLQDKTKQSFPELADDDAKIFLGF
jgi:protein kinase A